MRPLLFVALAAFCAEFVTPVAHADCDCSRSSYSQTSSTGYAYSSTPIYAVPAGQRFFATAPASMVLVTEGSQFAAPDQLAGGLSVDSIVSLIRAITEIVAKGGGIGGGGGGGDGGGGVNTLQKQIDDIKVVITAEQGERKKLTDQLASIQKQLDALTSQVGDLQKRVDRLAPPPAPATGAPSNN